MQDKKFTERLKQRLTIEFQNQDRSGAYGFTQRSMAYNSNKIEGSTFWTGIPHSSLAKIKNFSTPKCREIKCCKQYFYVFKKQSRLTHD